MFNWRFVKQMRRLPIYLVIDCSESMAGEAIDSVRNGVDALVRHLRSDPHALESVYLSVITFSNTAKQLVPLTELCQFRSPTLVLGSGTAMGAGLALWEQSIVRDLVKSTPEQKGDYKPICFLLTDGEPTDKWEAIADKIKSSISGKKAFVVAVACGPDASANKLKRISDDVILAKDLSPETFKTLFKWVSSSVATASQAVDKTGKSAIDLDNLPANCLEKAAPGVGGPEPAGDRFVFMHARCIKNKAFYIMRFAQQHKNSGIMRKPMYDGVASYKLEEFDFPVGTNEAGKMKTSTDQLGQPPPCPYCGNVQWAMCSCGKVHCCGLLSPGQSQTLTCPWCGKTDTYELSQFDVGRGAG